MSWRFLYQNHVEPIRFGTSGAPAGADEIVAGWMPPLASPVMRRALTVVWMAGAVNVVEPTMYVTPPAVDGWMAPLSTPRAPGKRLQTDAYTVLFGQPLDPSVFVSIIWTNRGGLYEHLDALFSGLTPTFQVCMYQTTGTVYMRLYDTTAAAAVADSQIDTTSATEVIVESGPLSLTDGHVYRAQSGVVSGDGGAFYSARVIYTP